MDNNNQLNIELTEEIAEGIYSNLSYYHTFQCGICSGFCKSDAGCSKSTREITYCVNPATCLLGALADNVQKYEAVHGTIKQTESIGMPMNFGGPTAQA
jgi:hypothetical protein